MENKSETKKNTNDVASSIIKGFRNVLIEHGLDKHTLAKFSIAMTANETSTNPDINCPPGFHLEEKNITENGHTTTMKVCVKDS